ncbi:MAG: NADH:flavin oxidoreductase [Dehalococcoidia bacterium]|jgi:2,4-dienoyl-CoA reductase-like NADH-dependent reductase (Old Yellow Enzyme family)
MSSQPDQNTPKVFTPGKIGKLALRNRTIRAGCFEGMCYQGAPSDALIEHHRKVAAGGIGMTTVAYCAPSRDGLAFGHEMWLRPEIIPQLQRLTDAVHREGAAASIQIGHCGFFANKSVIGQTPIGPSRKLCLFRYSFCRAMNRADMERVKEDFGNAASLAVRAGFDAVEIHAGHGYLLSQFLSPWTNRRRDEYGGSLENRLRFPTAVIAHVREAVGADYPLIVKMNVEDGFKGGLTVDEAVEVARRFEAAGASLLVPSCGFTARTSFFMMRGEVPIREYVRAEKNPFTKMGMALFGRFVVREFPFKRLFLFEPAKRIKNAVNIPVAYIGGVGSVDDMAKVMEAGFEFVVLGRATIKDPEVIRKMASGEISAVDCDHCNRCVAAMAAQGVSCVSASKGFKSKYRTTP